MDAALKEVPSMGKMYFSKEEACTELLVSLSTVSRWLKEGKISYRKVGRRVLIPTIDIINIGKMEKEKVACNE